MVVAAQRGLSGAWWLVLLEGIATLVLGLYLIVAPGMTMVVLVTFVGAYWLVAGILSIVRVFVGTAGIHWIWSLLIGIVGILAGLFVLRHPLYSSILVPATLVIVLGIQGLIIGVLSLVKAFQGEGLGALLLGILNIIIGIVLLISPLTAALAVPLVLGVFAIIGGIGLIVAAFRLR